ncbi:phosphoglycerate kinase [Candidatus Rhabdochlamydia porcellionis]|jgi:phosphoglycerate kinase|uniref:Phosphoglycerate kinase n=1 Tax=Candidatus Rhabdochlamydia porcellionis TaxID=225148 RepID=A0ABX8YZ69_9BACT|nr:phosphoglycerate kinase [Candidatus Rhabdochlamydia porcellionis]QZA58250.1 Phosphoglycerate kinase [Candidatus Rhabdochlamydia porcellionis]
MNKLSLKQLDVKNKKVLLRVDFNVPINEEGVITDDTRIKEALDSIQYILNHKGSVILMSHLGRPKGKPDLKLSLKPCAKALALLLKHPVLMAKDCIGPSAQNLAAHLQPNQILLLENLRFDPAEENPSSNPEFAKKLASFGNLYVNDAFGTAHREHSSTTAITKYFLGKSAMGFLMQKEINSLNSLIQNPQHPFYAIIGGAKISSKLGVLKSLLKKVDGLFIGGGMAYTLLKTQGYQIGNSICEEDQLDEALQLIKNCKDQKLPLWLPVDLLIADNFAKDANSKYIQVNQGIPDGWEGMDIGTETITIWEKALVKAATIFWNGPLGVFEFPAFAKGTEAIARCIASSKALSVVGGGDSVAAINQLHLTSSFSHISTGGGASLEYLELGRLPGIDGLSDS